MKEEDSQHPSANSRQKLKCTGIWGGIRNREVDVSAGRVIGSIYSTASEGGQGGDIYYFGVCKGDKITRLAIADVTGHGDAVSEVSQYVYDTLKAHMWEPDSRVILGEVNKLISSRSLDAMTTAAVVAYYSEESKARISYAGHPHVLYRRATDKAWSFAKPPGRKGLSSGPLMNLPLAVDSDTLYGQLTIPVTIGDQIFVYTDGIIDAPSPEGECFGYARLKNVLDANIKTPLSELNSAVLRILYQYTKKELTHDDITMIALEIDPKTNALKKEEHMTTEKQIKAFNDFYNTARNNEILDPKTTLLIHMATAMAVGCYPWMEHYLGVAKEEGITKDELGAVQSIVMAVSGGRPMMQFMDAQEKAKKKNEPVDSDCNGVCL